jgi:hypothetical protein
VHHEPHSSVLLVSTHHIIKYSLENMSPVEPDQMPSRGQWLRTTVSRQRAYVHFAIHSQVSMDLSGSICTLWKEKSLEIVSLISSVVSKSQNSNFRYQPIILAMIRCRYIWGATSRVGMNDLPSSSGYAALSSTLTN